MRPTYENSDHRKAQAEVAAIIEEKWNCRAIPMPRYYHVDYALTRDSEGKVGAIMEVKCRTVRKDTFETYILSVTKLMHMIALGSTMSVPVFLVVRWMDSLGYLRADCLNENLGVYIGGREDREDEDDTEPVIEIPMSEFKEVE